MAGKHVIIIPGGSCWRTHAEYIADLKETKFRPDFSPKTGWHESLPAVLGSAFKVFVLDMPNWQNAKYQEWKIWFEKAMAAAGGKLIVIGHSLGGIFLVKYFSETIDAPKIQGIFLVSAPYKTRAQDPDFGDFAFKGSFRRLRALGQKVHFYHSQDDPIVGFSDFKKYRKVLPDAVGKIFNHRGHFIQNRFPEIAADIRSLFHQK